MTAILIVEHYFVCFSLNVTTRFDSIIRRLSTIDKRAPGPKEAFLAWQTNQRQWQYMYSSARQRLYMPHTPHDLQRDDK